MKKPTKGQSVTEGVGCECEKDPNIEPHACPFEQEVQGNTDQEYCRCCAYCESNCANNI